MFKRVVFLFLLFGFGYSYELSSHPLHLTITNIEIENDSIKIAIRLFSADIRLAIFDFNGRNITANQTDTFKLTSENIDVYVNECFKISTQSGYLSLKSIKKSIDELYIWVYLNGELNINDTILTIENKLLNNLYGDQRNLVITSINKNEEGIEFNAAETKKTITLVD